jgi:L-rhamnose mutarotase
MGGYIKTTANPKFKRFCKILKLQDNIAFMIMDTVPDFDHEKTMKKLAGLPRQKEWEEYVSQFQQAGDKEATPEKWEPVERIFTLG